MGWKSQPIFSPAIALYKVGCSSKLSKWLFILFMPLDWAIKEQRSPRVTQEANGREETFDKFRRKGFYLTSQGEKFLIFALIGCFYGTV